MAAPLVSIIVPSYQQARFLRVAIDSALSQDYEPIEVLVMDGGSTDGSVEILGSYGGRIWFRSAPDGGQSQAINEGFGRSRGEIVAWLNSDDFYYPGAVRAAVAALQSRPDAAAVYGEGDLVDEQGARLRRFPETVPFDFWRLCNVADYILQPTVFCRRGPLFRCGLLDEKLRWGLDWELWMRLGAQMPFAYTPEVLAASRIHGDTKTATGGARRLRELLGILHARGGRGLSPAAIAHGITTLVRSFVPSQDAVTADVVASRIPRPARPVVRSVVSRTERRLRRWLENAQGVWSDGLVGSVGHLWLPTLGGRTSLRVSGRNLDLCGQVVGLRSGRSVARTAVLEPGESFDLAVSIDAPRGPVKATLSCARTVSRPAMDASLGCRRVGFEVRETRLVAPGARAS